jgi:hypothetical protein
MGEELVAAAMVKVEVRVHHQADILWPQPEQLQRAGDGLVGRLDRLFEGQHLHHMRMVEARIDQDPLLRRLHQDGIDGEADLPAGPLFQNRWNPSMTSDPPSSR